MVKTLKLAAAFFAAVLLSTGVAHATDAYRLNIGGGTYPSSPVIMSCVDDSTAPTYKAKPCGNAANPVATSIAPSSSSSVGIAPVVSTAAEACHVLKNAAGNLYGLTATIGATSGYLMVFNATSAPSDGAVTPKWWFPIKSDGTFGGAAAAWTIAPLYFSTGITVCFSTTGPFTKTASATAAFSGEVQ